MTERKYQDSDFADPILSCDVIMKGGITSGVLYPLALAELAKRSRFSNIGGTSAGAIAAAAAEYGRNVPGKGFLRLTTLPAEAGAILFTLFQPTATVKPLFNILVAALRAKSTAGRTVRVVAAAIWGFRWSALVAAKVREIPHLAARLDIADGHPFRRSAAQHIQLVVKHKDLGLQ